MAENDALLERYSLLGIDISELTKSRTRNALRVNTLKIAEEELVARLRQKGVKLEKVPFLKNGYFYESKFSLGATPEYLQGFYYLQEAASQVPAEVLMPQPGEAVLDMAASPGSKTTHIAQLMENRGIIVAIDNDPKRFGALKNNLERCSVKSCTCMLMDARNINSLDMQFDRILLDAPCSGNFCVERNFFSKRKPEDFSNRAELQKELLNAAISVLKKGGTLVYSTCSLEPEEDELVIDWLLKAHPNLVAIDTGMSVGDPGMVSVFGKELNPEVAKCRRFWPNKTGTQGFFVAKLKKS